MSFIVKLISSTRFCHVNVSRSIRNCKYKINSSEISPILCPKKDTYNWENFQQGRCLITCSEISATNLKVDRSLIYPRLELRRNSSFFNTRNAEALWKAVTSVSNAGKKRGRGKGNRKIMSKDLNKGQFIGVGEENIVWPGLNSPIMRENELVKQEILPKDENRAPKLIEIRDKMGVFRPLKLNPLERGWSGTRLPGRSIGPPDPIEGDPFHDFDTKVLECKTVATMTGNLGRKQRMSLFVVTGNQNGLAGFGLAKASTIKNASRKAKNIAGQRLMYIDRCDGHTVYHDFFSEFMQSRIFVKRKPQGYGLVCHRALREICKAIGIKNIHCKCEGSMNVQNMTKAFFMGLLGQFTHQQLADKKKLHVAKIRHGCYPEIVASPSSGDVRSKEEIGLDEELDFKLYTMDGRVEIQRKKFVPFYHHLPSYETFLKKEVKRRNHYKIKKQLTVEYGEVISFLTENHPECRRGYEIKDED